MRRIYFDNAATTKVRKEVIEEMMPYFDEKFGNPSSLHYDGQIALKAVDFAREKIKNILNADSIREIIFTSSATESNNLAIKGLIFYGLSKAKIKLHEHRAHIITSSIEHPSVLEPLADLEEMGFVKTTYLKPNKNGIIEIEEIKNSIRENTILVTLHYINSEIGVRQKVKEIGEMLSSFNKIYFHIDAAQAGFENLDVKELKFDMMTLSAHKIFGPKGISVLYVKEGVPLKRIISGSEDEYDLRGGTLNVPFTIGIAKALELAQLEKEKINKHLRELRDYFLKKMEEFKGKIELNNNPEFSSPKIISLYFPKKESQEILFYLDQKGISVSQGTACMSRAVDPSYVVKEIFGSERAKRSIRISFGIFNSKEDIDYLFDILKNFL